MRERFRGTTSAEQHAVALVFLPRDPTHLGDRVGDGDEPDLGTDQRGHLAPLPGVRGLDRRQPQAGGQDAVKRGGRAAALDVAEHRGPRLKPGALLYLALQDLADAAQAGMAELV